MCIILESPNSWFGFSARGNFSSAVAKKMEKLF